MGIITATRNLVRENFSPRLTRFYARLGFANRELLAANLRGLQFDKKNNKYDREKVIDKLVSENLLKKGFAGTPLDKLQPHMFFGTIAREQYANFAREIDLTIIRDETKTDADFRKSVDSVDLLTNRLAGLIYKAGQPTGTGKFGTGLSLAFALGAGTAAVIGLSLAGPSFSALAGISLALTAAAKVVGRWLNPAFSTGKFFRRLFYVSLGALLLTGILAIKERQYPRYTNHKDIAVTSVDNEIRAKVCDAGACREGTVFAYQGPDAAGRARESAEKLQEVINEQDLFQGGIIPEGNKIIVTDNWLPGWVPFSTTEVIDISAEGLTGDARQNRLVSFYNGLWSSGIMPSSRELAEFELQKLERQLDFRLWRDVRLSTKLQLASLAMQLGDYPRALDLSQQIIDNRLAVTSARAPFTDEAVFLQADIYRIKAMKSWSDVHIAQAVRLLQQHQGQLKPEENGYLSRYAFELLKTCTIARQFFPRGEWEGNEACSPAATARYAEAATFGHNRYSPTFSDNFLGVRTFLQSGSLLYSGGELAAAREEYQKALALANLIDDCGNVTGGDTDRNWRLYSPYMTDVDRGIGDALGQPSGLLSFAARCEVGRLLRGDTPLKKFTNQFDPTFFKVFKAQAYQGLAAIEIKQAKTDRDHQLERLTSALLHLKSAFEIVRAIQRDDIFRFFTGMFEEKQTYYEVLADYADLNFSLYTLGGGKFADKLALARELADEVAGQRASEPLDIPYLRAILLKGELALLDGKKREALGYYRLVLDNIAAAEKQLAAGEPLPPHYQMLQESALIRTAILSEINP